MANGAGFIPKKNHRAASSLLPIFGKRRPHILHELADVTIVEVIEDSWHHVGFIEDSVIEERIAENIADNRRM